MREYEFDKYPTILPDGFSQRLCRCPICDKPICEDDHIVLIDAGNVKAIVHENCATFRENILIDFLDILGIDYYTGQADEIIGI